MPYTLYLHNIACPIYSIKKKKFILKILEKLRAQIKIGNGKKRKLFNNN